MLLLLLALSPLAFADPPSQAQADAQAFLDSYDSLYRSLYRLDVEANWDASTDVGPENSGRRTAADQMLAAFLGDPVVIARTRALLLDRAALTPLQVQSLERILVAAAANPGNAPELVNARFAAEAQLAAIQDGFVYCLDRQPDGACGSQPTANDIDELLQSEVDLDRRRAAWEASKEIGVPLKAPLAETVALRNAVARKNGYSSYFGLMVAEYGMTTQEMMTLLDDLVVTMQPLYRELSTWTGHQLAARYGAPVPTGPLPAHWLPNRWGQEWGGLVAATDYDPYFAGRSPEWIVRSAEEFYTSIGFPALPAEFWERSDLYPVPAGDPRQKNSHASAWNIDFDQDLRSLMSVEADTDWFSTAHHELGHIYYYVSYNRPEVPVVLREGANRAFHEAVGELAALASVQVPYLKEKGILPRKVRIDPVQDMLNQALTQTVVFVPFAAGTMAHFEAALYEEELPPEQWQARWWQLVGQYQGIAPPDPARIDDPSLCDACTKTHIIDDPAGYYDYALATVIKYQLHRHIAEQILHQDPRSCSYAGHPEVGTFLKGILEKGATQDWRQVLKEATGEELSTEAMVAYFAPLQGWLERENAKAARRARR